LNMKSKHIDLILESLKFTRDKIQNYEHYPSYEFRLQRLKYVDDARVAFIELIKKEETI